MLHQVYLNKQEMEIGNVSANHSLVHYVKYRNFTKFPGVEILWKGKVAA